MRKLSLTLETVTPLFLAGAEPESSGELRPASFRGGMRYWLRAMLGANYPIDQVREIEKQVFGTADQDIGAAKVSLTTSSSNLQFVDYRPRPSGNRQKASGHDYLYWSMNSMGQKPKRLCAMPGQRFKLSVCSRPGTGQKGEEFRLATLSLWLLFNLGGVGARSRRTGGSLSPVFSDGDVGIYPPFLLGARSGPEHRDKLVAGLKVIFENKNKIVPTREFAVLNPGVCKIWVIGGETEWDSWEKAVEGIGIAMRDYRSHHQPDYQSIKDVLVRNGNEATVQRAVFGLPIQFRFTGIQGSVFITAGQYERRASPLHLRVTKLTNGKYVGIAVLFKSSFLPQGEKLKAKRAIIEPPDENSYQMIEQFITTGFQNIWEVIGW